jgi:hypothetical protein
MTDDRLRAAYERLLAERGREPVERPVSLDEMLAVLEKRGGETERLDVMNRVMRHPSQRQEFDVLRAAHQASRQPRHVPFIWQASIAAGLLIAAVAGSRLLKPTATEPDVLRGNANVTVPLYEPAQTAVADSARSFLWAHVAGASRYSFTLMDLEGRPLYDTVVSDTTLALPDSVRLTAGGEYRWRVKASTPSGEEVSEYRPLRLRP